MIRNIGQPQTKEAKTMSYAEFSEEETTYSRKTSGIDSIVTYQYDALNRITQINHSDATLDSQYRYDEQDTSHHYGTGRLTGMDDASYSTEYDLTRTKAEITIIYPLD